MGDDYAAFRLSRGRMTKAELLDELVELRRRVDQSPDKAVVEQLQVNEELFRSVVEQSPNGIFIMDFRGRIFEWNRSMEAITSLTRTETLGRNMFEVMHGLMREEVRNPEMLERIKRGYLHFIQTGNVTKHQLSVENIIQCVDGARRFIEIILFRVRLETDTVSGGIVRDITDRKRDENEIKKNLEELTILNYIANTGMEAGGQEELFGSIASMIRGALGADSCGIFIAGDEGIERYPRDATFGMPASHVQKFIDRIKNTDDGFIIDDPSRDGIPVSAAHLAHTSICVPLKTPDGVIGFILAESASKAVFCEADARLLMTVACQLKITIDKKRLMESLERVVGERTRHLSVLYSLMGVASQSADLKLTLERSLDSILEAVEGAEGSIYLLGDKDERLELAIRKATLSGGVADSSPPAALEAIIAGVLSSGATLSVPDSRDVPLMAIPLLAGGRVVGALCVRSQPDRPFSADDEALLSSVAIQMGLTVEVINLWKKTEMSAIKEERERLAGELHDSVTQLLYSLTLFAQTGLDFASKGDSSSVVDRLKTMGEISRQALKEMRLMVYGLMPLALEQDGFAGAISCRLETVEKRLGISASLSLPSGRFSPVVEELLYWVSQEALNNTLKHANASEVLVSLAVEGDILRLRLADNGTGFDSESANDRHGLGLNNIRQRIRRFGGSLEVTSTKGAGTSIVATIPYEGERP